MRVFNCLLTLVIVFSFHYSLARTKTTDLSLSQLDHMIGLQSNSSLMKEIKVNALHFGDRLISFRIDNVPIKVSWHYQGERAKFRLNGEEISERAVTDQHLLQKEIYQILNGKKRLALSPILSFLFPRAHAGSRCPWNRRQTRRNTSGLAGFFRNLFSRIRNSFRVRDARNTRRRGNPCPNPAGTPVVTNGYDPTPTSYDPYSGPDMSGPVLDDPSGDVDAPDAAPLADNTGVNILDDNPFNSDPAVVSGKVYYISY